MSDYDKIRDAIEAVIPDFYYFNQRIKQPGGFYLPNAAATRQWLTESKKANFIPTQKLLEDPRSACNSELVLARVRSHDQYNTTLYGMNDRYRGIFGQRDVVFISAVQAKNSGVKTGDRVNLTALLPDGTRSTRTMSGLTVVIYDMAERSLVTYFPETNHMVVLDNYDEQYGIPAYKSIPVIMDNCKLCITDSD